MSALSAIREGLVGLGYPPGSLRRAYRFGDVLGGGDLQVALAAFTSSPSSYRSAAFGVIEGGTENAAAIVSRHRSLGAPYLFLVSGHSATLWTYGTGGSPTRTAQIPTEALQDFFRLHAADWAPDAIRRAKRSRHFDVDRDPDLFDGLAIDELAHVTRARLQAVIQSAVGALGPIRERQLRPALRGLFRLLAAKVLVDRDHEAAMLWPVERVEAVLAGISLHYDLSDTTPAGIGPLPLENAWDVLRRGINLANVSADDLAFVYENTFVTADTRAEYATHSTPAVVAQHIVGSIDFSRFDPNTIRIYEPFCGASPLMLAAMASLRDLLPAHIHDRTRHELMVAALSGDDADPFAVEVSKLSLILADWPNGNGWDIGEADLFEGDRLPTRLAGADVVLCNPPFETFTGAERDRYGRRATRETKSALVLSHILAARPAAFGVVMPRTLLQGSTYVGLRRRVEDIYGDIRTVSLPDKIFLANGFESALLIAQDRRSSPRRPVRVTSDFVRDADRHRYLASGRPSEIRTALREPGEATGQLWVRSLEDLWHFLRDRPRLGDLARIHRGLEWSGVQTEAISPTPREGFVEGLGNIRSAIHQFSVGRTAYLDVRKDSVRRAFGHPWGQPKIIANAVRHGRGRWPLAAAVDERRLYLSQQFFGIWPNDEANLDAMSAILNGPLANAYVIDGSGAKGLKVDALETLPLPQDMASLADIGIAIREYVEEARALVLNDPSSLARVNARLHAVDDMVLRAYALPSDLEDDLKSFFDGHDADRTLSHPFLHWWEATDGLSESEEAFLRLLDRSDLDSAPAENERFSRLMARLDALAGDTEFEIDLNDPIEDEGD